MRVLIGLFFAGILIGVASGKFVIRNWRPLLFCATAYIELFVVGLVGPVMLTCFCLLQDINTQKGMLVMQANVDRQIAAVQGPLLHFPWIRHHKSSL